jgi:hypothetical protein
LATVRTRSSTTAPAAARSIRCSLEFVDGPNVYAYVNSTPTMRVDPKGLQEETAPSRPWWAPPPNPLAELHRKGVEGLWKFCVRLFSDKPNTCTPEQQRRYQENVENQCGAAAACHGTDSVDVLNQKIGQHSRCIDARRLINDVCYGGGDKGHNDAIDQRVNAIRNCQRLLSQPRLR